MHLETGRTLFDESAPEARDLTRPGQGPAYTVKSFSSWMVVIWTFCVCVWDDSRSWYIAFSLVCVPVKWNRFALLFVVLLFMLEGIVDTVKRHRYRFSLLWNGF